VDNLLQEPKALLLKVVTPKDDDLSTLTVVKLAQRTNAESPILVTLDGIVIVVKLLQLANV
jgi:hypothetical protein